MKTLSFERHGLRSPAVVLSFAVVKDFDVSGEFFCGFLSCGGNAGAEVVEALGFERCPKTFHQSVIVAVATAAHALSYSFLSKQCASVEAMCETLRWHAGFLDPRDEAFPLYLE